MPRPEMDLVALGIARGKKRQAADVVEMGVAVEKVGIDGAAVLDQLRPELAEPGAAVEDQQPLAAAHFDARGIATVAHGFGAGAGYAAANAPEPDRDIPRWTHVLPIAQAASLVALC